MINIGWDKRGTPRNYKWFLFSTSALIKTVTKFSNTIGYQHPDFSTNRTVDGVVGQLKGQWTHHACVSEQNASCVRAVVLHFAMLTFFFFLLFCYYYFIIFYENV